MSGSPQQRLPGAQPGPEGDQRSSHPPLDAPLGGGEACARGAVERGGIGRLVPEPRRVRQIPRVQVPLAGRHPSVQPCGDRAAGVPERQVPARWQAGTIGPGGGHEARHRLGTIERSQLLELGRVPGGQLGQAERPCRVTALGPVEPALVPLRHGQDVPGQVARRPIATGDAAPAAGPERPGRGDEGVDALVVQAQHGASGDAWHRAGG